MNGKEVLQCVQSIKGSYLEYIKNSHMSIRKMTDNPKDLKNYIAKEEIHNNQGYEK